MRPSRREAARGLALALAPFALTLAQAAQEASDEPPPEAPPAPQPSAPGIELSGWLRTRYRGQFADGDDHDLYELIDLQAKDAAGRWSASVLARIAYDLDDGPPSLDGLLDTYDSPFEPQLYHAYLDWESSRFERLRLGRQTLIDTPLTVVLDGLSAELTPRGPRDAKLGAYVGVGEHLYESSDDGDAPVLGTYAGLDLWTGGVLRADWMHLEDLRLGSEFEDDLFGLAFDQGLTFDRSDTRLELDHTRLEGERRDWTVRASHVDLGARWSARASYHELLRAQGALAAPLDPFSSTLFTLFPYRQLGASATKDWSRVSLSGGADLRRVSDEADEGTYNRDFERYHLTTALIETLPVELAVTGEVWDSSDTEFSTWGANLSREHERFEWSLGSYYSLYKYDLLTGDERDDVRTYYVDLAFRPEPLRRWSLRYELEDNAFDLFHQVRLDYAWGF